MQETRSASSLVAPTETAPFNLTRSARRERIRAEMRSPSVRTNQSAVGVIQDVLSQQNTPVAHTENIFAILRTKRAQDLAETARHIQAMAARHHLEFALLDAGVDDLLGGITDLTSRNQEIDRQLFALKAQLASLMAAHQHIARTLDGACGQEIRQLEELSVMLANHSQASDDAFQFMLKAILEGLDQAVLQQQQLNKCELEIKDNLQDAHSETISRLNDLEREIPPLDLCLTGLQERVYAQAQNGVEIALLIDEMSSETYCQQELERLQNILNCLPDATLDYLAPLYKKIKDDFARGVQHIANHNFKEQLATLQAQILENSVSMIQEQLNGLEQQNVRVQMQIAALPSAIANNECALLQLQLNTKQVEKLIKQLKSTLKGVTKSLVMGGASFLTSGSVSWALDIAISATGIGEKIDRLARKIMKPLSPLLTKITAPIANIVAPLSPILSNVSMITGPLMAVVGNGSLQQALQVVNKISAFSQKAINHISNPIGALTDHAIGGVLTGATAIYTSIEATDSTPDEGASVAPPASPKEQKPSQTSSQNLNAQRLPHTATPPKPTARAPNKVEHQGSAKHGTLLSLASKEGTADGSIRLFANYMYAPQPELIYDMASHLINKGCNASESITNLCHKIENTFPSLFKDQRPKALVLTANDETDHNGALDLSFRNGYRVLTFRQINKLYNTKYERMSSKESLCQAIDMAKQNGHTADILILRAHGSQHSMDLSANENLTSFDNFPSHSCLMNLSPNATIIIDSCSTGHGKQDAHNLANKIAAFAPPNARIFAASEDTIFFTIKNTEPLEVSFKALEPGLLPSFKDITYKIEPAEEFQNEMFD